MIRFHQIILYGSKVIEDSLGGIIYETLVILKNAFVFDVENLMLTNLLQLNWIAIQLINDRTSFFINFYKGIPGIFFSQFIIDSIDWRKIHKS